MFMNVAEAFVLSGSAIERNVWFRPTLSATGIRPRSVSAAIPDPLLRRDPRAFEALERAYRGLGQAESTTAARLTAP